MCRWPLITSVQCIYIRIRCTLEWHFICMCFTLNLVFSQECKTYQMSLMSKTSLFLITIGLRKMVIVDKFQSFLLTYNNIQASFTRNCHCDRLRQNSGHLQVETEIAA